ncbi:MAG: DUF2905 family protein [Armatimonadota bacterium]|nr:DUF2905 family protein [Armatimonadota bacterium]
MTPLAPLGRMLIVIGLVLVVAGVLLTYVGRIPRLPGDIVIERPNLTVFVPIGWMIVISVVLTLLLNVLFRR